MEGYTPRAEYLASYNRVDIALDPFPYPGGTTTIEGLWMGVPIITKKGNRFLSHAGETIANNAGLQNWIAKSDDDYVEELCSKLRLAPLTGKLCLEQHWGKAQRPLTPPKQ